MAARYLSPLCRPCPHPEEPTRAPRPLQLALPTAAPPLRRPAAVAAAARPAHRLAIAQRGAALVAHARARRSGAQAGGGGGGGGGTRVAYITLPPAPRRRCPGRRRHDAVPVRASTPEPVVAAAGPPPLRPLPDADLHPRRSIPSRQRPPSRRRGDARPRAPGPGPGRVAAAGGGAGPGIGAGTGCRGRARDGRAAGRAGRRARPSFATWPSRSTRLPRSSAARRSL